MKKIYYSILSFLLLLMAHYACAQPIIDHTWAPKLNDVTPTIKSANFFGEWDTEERIFRLPVEYQGAEIKGVDALWDYTYFQDAEEPFIDSSTYKYTPLTGSEIDSQFPSANIKLSFLEVYYRINESEMSCIGHASDGTIVKSTPPEIKMKFPFRFLDSLEQQTILKITGLRDTEMSIKKYYDGFGKLITPYKEYSEVVRIKTVTKRLFEDDRGSKFTRLETEFEWFDAKLIPIASLRISVGEVIDDRGTSPLLTHGSFTWITSDIITTKQDEVSSNIPLEEDAIFLDFSWLKSLVDQSDCINTSITVYSNGIYQYLLVEDATSSTLYNQDGVFYCQNAPNYDCVAAYNLIDVIATWNCNTTQEENEPPTPPQDASLFTDYDWLNTLIDQNNCAATITVYSNGIYQYLLVEDTTSSMLYNQDGVFYCQNAPNYDCVSAYNLTEVITRWSCNNFNAPSINPKLNKVKSFNDDLTIYPNPASERLFIEIPTNSTQEIQTIQVLDINGRILQSLKMETIKKEIDISTYPAGMYFIKWHSNSTPHAKRFIIQ